jgi:hypothetical protein
MKTVLKSAGMEQDVVYWRNVYAYLKNNPKLVKFAKRAINKRIRLNKNYET